MCKVWLKIASYILRRSNLKNPTFDRTRFGCRIFDRRLIECRKSDIQRSELRMSNIWHSTDGWWNVKSPIFNGFFPSNFNAWDSLKKICECVHKIIFYFITSKIYLKLSNNSVNPTKTNLSSKFTKKLWMPTK